MTVTRQPDRVVANPGRVLIGCLLGAVALWLALRGADPGQLWHIVARARPIWIVAAVASVGVTVAVAVARWRVLLQQPGEHRAWWPLFHALVVGQMINVLLPIRLGEVVRAYIAGRAEAIPVARVLTTIAVEKLGDLMVVGLAAGCLLAFVSLPDWVHGPGRALVLTGTAAAAAALLLGARADAVAWLVRLAARIVPVAARPRLERELAPATEGLTGIRTWNGRLALWGLSLVVMLLAASTNYLLCLAFELPVPATGAIVLLVALQFSNTIVSVPGNLGVFHYVTVLVLSYYGVERNASVAYAIVLHTVAVVPKVVAGTGFLLFSSARVDLRELAARGTPDVTAGGERRVRVEGHPGPIAPVERSSKWQNP